jgi:hypothetical protein
MILVKWIIFVSTSWNVLLEKNHYGMNYAYKIRVTWVTGNKDLDIMVTANIV